MKIDRDALNCSRICEGKMFYYSVREDGAVIKTSKIRFKESRARPYIRRGMAAVKINNRDYTLKNLVAEHFIEEYKKGDYVEAADGDPFNCAVGNLRIYTQKEHGERTGFRSRSHKIIADGVEYRSVRECARALFVSYQTVLDFLGGKSKKSVLQGVEIEILK